MTRAGRKNTGMKGSRVMKKALRRAMRDILIVVALLGLIFGGAGLWSETRQSRASDFGMPTLPAVRDQEGEADPRVDFASLRRGAPEALAWIAVPGTQIDYPVTQWTDNQYFLTRTARHEASRYGSIFMDYRNNSDFSDFFTILYGHNMRSGKMFGTLREFRDDEFFDRVQYGSLRTPDKTYRLQFFAWAVGDSTGEYYKNLAFVIPGEKEAFLRMCRETARRWREVPLNAGDHIVALSTCASESESARMLLLAKLVEQQ